MVDEDPIHIMFDDIENFDEYDSEAHKMTSLLDTATSDDELLGLIWYLFFKGSPQMSLAEGPLPSIGNADLGIARWGSSSREKVRFRK